MDKYQTLEQHGVRELVKVAVDEDGLPCIFLRDIERVFPNTTFISSCGVRVPFAMDSANIPKQPLRIYYFENRVLKVESENSALEWSREATAARIAAAAASVAASITTVNTVHTLPVPGFLDLGIEGIDYRGNESDHVESEDFVDMAESSDHEEEEQLVSRRLHPQFSSAAIAPISRTLLTTTAATPVTYPTITTRTLRTVQSLNNLPQEPFEAAPEHTPSSTSTIPPIFDENLAILEETELEHDTTPLPLYEVTDPSLHQHIASRLISQMAPTSSSPFPTMDDLAEHYLVHDRLGIIKRVSQAILTHKYEAESCPHPPLFILLPENPLQWSFENILHNKMRLHFLCDCCEHEIYIHDPHHGQRTLANKRNVHMDESKGFEIRLDQYHDQVLLVKFGNYVLSLLRMMKYGVSLDNIFVTAAFDRPVPPLMSVTEANLGGKSGMDPQIFFKRKQNIERSIAFMEVLLGVNYDEEASETLSGLDMDDFRVLDYIVKRPPYAQSTKTESTVSGTSSFSLTSPTVPNIDHEQTMGNVHIGGSGLHKVQSADGRVRWACYKFYKMHHQNLDKIFANKLEYHQATLDPHTRSSVFVASSESHLNAKIISVSKVRALFQVDLTIDWNFDKRQLITLADVLGGEALAVSTLAVRLTKRVPPLAWKKNTLARNGDDQQPINAIINLMKNQRIRHLILEGDIDLMSVPNIGTMDFTNLDILSIMRTSNRGYVYSNANSSSVGSNDNFESGNIIPVANGGSNQETNIPELISLVPPCSFLAELSLGFPNSIPGHIRILQACIAGFSSLKRVDLFRVLGARTLSGSKGGNGGGINFGSGTRINRKLELSASISGSRITRLYMAECKATGEGKARLLESMEELLTDDSSYLEDLEMRFMGFNDKHAHALELGTRPIPGDSCCRLRRLVIHGNGLEHGGVYALKRVLRRATKPARLSEALSMEGRSSNINTSSSAQVIVSAPAAVPTAAEHPEPFCFRAMMEQPTLIHLELCSLDSLTDSDWASLLSDLNMQRLTTLDLQGVWFGDRAMAMLAKTGNSGDALDLPSPPHSPTSESSTFASSYMSSPPAPLPPPAFFSPSSPLHLQTLRLSCSALSHRGVSHMQEFLSRLTHLSTISLHGFRKVTSEDWMDITARIAFRWVEAIEIVSSGYDDVCARYLGERIRVREQMPEDPRTTATSEGDVAPPEAALPKYSAQPTVAASSSSSIASTSSSMSSSPPRASRRESISSRLFNSRSPTSGLKSMDKDRNKTSTSSTTPSVVIPPPASSRPNPSQKYLEIDLRYTDVSSMGLALLRTNTIGQAKKVVVRTRDGENEECGDDEDRAEITRLAAKFGEKDETEEKTRRNGKGRTVAGISRSTQGPSTSVLFSGAYINTFATASSFQSPLSVTQQGSGSRSSSSQQPQPPTRSSTFMKLKGAFKKF